VPEAKPLFFELPQLTGALEGSLISLCKGLMSPSWYMSSFIFGRSSSILSSSCHPPLQLYSPAYHANLLVFSGVT
jgi:hypothetical protein